MARTSTDAALQARRDLWTVHVTIGLAHGLCPRLSASCSASTAATPMCMHGRRVQSEEDDDESEDEEAAALRQELENEEALEESYRAYLQRKGHRDEVQKVGGEGGKGMGEVVKGIK